MILRGLILADLKVKRVPIEHHKSRQVAEGSLGTWGSDGRVRMRRGTMEAGSTQEQMQENRAQQRGREANGHICRVPWIIEQISVNRIQGNER